MARSFRDCQTGILAGNSATCISRSTGALTRGGRQSRNHLPLTVAESHVNAQLRTYLVAHSRGITCQCTVAELAVVAQSRNGLVVHSRGTTCRCTVADIDASTAYLSRSGIAESPERNQYKQDMKCFICTIHIKRDNDEKRVVKETVVGIRLLL